MKPGRRHHIPISIIACLLALCVAPPALGSIFESGEDVVISNVHVIDDDEAVRSLRERAQQR